MIDDPQSIVRCTNKVYLAELLSRHDIPIPKTVVLHPENSVDAVAGTRLSLRAQAARQLVLPRRRQGRQRKRELDEQLKILFEDSDLVVAQEFLPTTFDWRIGILNRKPLYACKYYHGAKITGRSSTKTATATAGTESRETIPVELAPRRAVGAALKAANLIGDGLYGVDVKESNKKFYVIEVNDNPNIDAGVEDAVLREELYNRIMEVFLDRIERSKAGTVDT